MRAFSQPSTKTKNTVQPQGFTVFLVEATGFEPTTFASRTQRATNCATPRFGFFRKWSNMWSNHSFRDFFIKLYWQNCQVFQGVQRFAKLAKSYSVICSRTRRATSCATPRIITNVIIPNANTIVNSFLTPFLPFSKK